MSRTHKDRPYWVLKNDPTFDRYALHNHLVVLLEEIGEEPVYRTVYDKDGWHTHAEVWYMRKLYRRTPVHVDCTLDVAEDGAHNYWSRSKPKTNEDRLAQKNCHWWLEYYPNVHSSKDMQRLTNGAIRSKVRQQLNSAVRDYGSYWEDGDWDDVDIFVDNRYISSKWWD